LCTVLLALAAAPATAAPGGVIGTIETGRWFCELPGDASRPAQATPEEDFIAVKDSSYLTPKGEKGTYLLLGNDLAMTSGPLAGQRFRRDSLATMHKLDAQMQPTALRCVRAGDPAANAAPIR
jgi:hypothetical protein